MKKTKSFLSIFFVFVFFGTLVSANLINPSKVSALSSSELASRAHTILKLEAFKKCVNDSLKWSGIDKGKGPFDVSFVAGGSLGAIDKAVGYGVEKGDGRWDCGSPSGEREDQYFKLLLRNGSKDKYYTGWDSGSFRYNGADNKNVKDIVGDNNPQLYFINEKNDPNYPLKDSNNAINTAAKAHAKVNAQINDSIKKQEEGLDNKEKSAMLYASLADTFFSNNACDSKEVDQNDSGEKVKIGNKWYSVPVSERNNERKFAVGHGAYGWGASGEATCRDIGTKMSRHQADYFAVTKEKDAIPKGSTNGTAGDPASTTNDIQSECTITASFITWIMCPLIEGFTLAVETLDTQITGLLNIDTDQYFGDDDTGQGFKEVWTSIRTISIGILVILALVMIISTAISMGPFDAYTVKKVMPRLLMVIVLIAISWPLVKFLIEMSNALGFAVRGLIQAPFVNQGVVKVSEGEATVAGVALLGGGFALGLPGLLSFLVTAFLAVMIAFLVLILRQILVVLLAVIAPIALVSFILPNTSKFGKFWWDSFSKALLAFPIISGFIAIGRVFASVAYSVGGPISGYIAFIAYFAPYFLIPQAFKMAGGILGNLSGMVNDRGRGAFDRLKNFRQGQTKKNWENTLNQRRFNPEGKLGRFNSATQSAALIGAGKVGVDPRRMGGRLGDEKFKREFAEAEHLMADNDAVKAGFNDDDIMTAASTMHGREAIAKFLKGTKRYGHLQGAELNQTVSAVEAIQKSGSQGAIQAVAAIAHAASGTGGTPTELLAEAQAASHGSQYMYNRLIAAQRSAAGNSRRPDFAALGHTELEAFGRRLAAGEDAGAIEGEMLTRAMEVGGAGVIVNAREEPFGQLCEELGSRYIAARDAGEVETATDLASQITSLRNASGQATPENRRNITALLDAVGVDPSKINAATGAALSTDEQLGEAIAGIGLSNATYVAEIERNYGSVIDQQTSDRVAAETLARTNVGNRTPLSPAEIARIRSRMLESVAKSVSGQSVRTRAGLYDAGGGNRTPEQIRAAQGGQPTP